MTFFKPPRRSDEDAARFFGGTAETQAADRAADPFFAGQQAYSQGAPRRCPLALADITGTDKWLSGWDAAALEAGRWARQHRRLIAESKTVRDTLEEAGRVLRRVDQDWSKKPLGLKAQISAARMSINAALVLVPDAMKPAAAPEPAGENHASDRPAAYQAGRESAGENRHTHTGPEGDAAPGA